ncbi:MAG: hypothetical protein AAF192_02835 [Pseudomonadota bacterium]
MKRPIQAMAAAAASVLIAGAAHATSFSPTSEFFEELTGATFGGSGIPNDPAAFSTFAAVDASGVVTGDVLTLGLIATQRYSNPELTNDGAGTYTAGRGSNFGGAGESSLEGALWNLGFYASVEGSGGGVLSDFDLSLRYDFDPGADTPAADLGSISINGSLNFADLGDGGVRFQTQMLLQGSENMFFGFLGTPVPGVLTAPAFGPFDPDAVGEYSFAFEVGAGANSNVDTGADHVAIQVNVVPVPVALPMLASAFGIAALVRRRARSV